MGSSLAIDGPRAPAGTGGHRPSALKPHAEFLKQVLAEKPDITLKAIAKRLLAARSVKADTSMLSRFFRREGITLKKRRWWPASKIGRTSAVTVRVGANISMLDRPQAPRFHRRDLDENQHDAQPRLDRSAADGSSTKSCMATGQTSNVCGRPCATTGSTRLACSRGRSTASASSPMSMKNSRPPSTRTTSSVAEDLRSHKSKAVRQAIRNVGARLIFLLQILPRSQSDRAQLLEAEAGLERRPRPALSDDVCDAIGEILKTSPRKNAQTTSPRRIRVKLKAERSSCCRPTARTRRFRKSAPSSPPRR